MERRSILILGIALCLGLSVGCQRPAGLSEADQTAIRQGDLEYARLMNAKDFKGVAALYADDAIVLPPNQAMVEGRAAIQAWIESFPPTSNFQMQTLEIEGGGNLAYVRGAFSLTMAPSGAAPVEERGKYMEIWRQQADGSWKIAQDIWNSDLPLPVSEKPPEPVKKK